MKTNICESNRLEAYLQGALPEQGVNELMKHLDGCGACRKELEQLAAAPARWIDVKIHLSRTTSRQVQPNAGVENEKTVPFTIRQVIEMLDPTDDPSSIGRLGGYEVVGAVGSGAMGVVLKAVDQTLDRVVALKVMNPTLATCGTARYRFAREAKAAAGVLHPNVIAIHGVSTERDLPYLVMPYIAGTSLQQRMDRQGPLELVEILRIGSQIAAGLVAAHKKGVIHRDIKPSNVMLDEGVETALITDFGLARTIDDATMTRSGSIAGTPEYMSPEQARGDAVDCTSDVFSLGSVLYALCCGNRPFRAKTSFGVLRKITDEEPKPIREINPKIPLWLCKLIERMHAKTPNQRPSSAEIHDLLEACLAHVYLPDRISIPKELGRSDPPSSFTFSKPFLIGVLSIMSIVFIAIFIFALQQNNDSPDNVAVAGAVSSSEKVANNEPTVFKTLNLNFPKADQEGTLVIDINRGFVEVVGHQQTGVVIEILTPPGFEKFGKQEFKLSKIFSPKYDLKSDSKKNLIKLDAYNQSFVLNLRIKVPNETNLNLDAYHDGIEVQNVSGVIRTRSQHSDIRLLDISGSATAYSYNGNFAVRFKEVAPTANLDFESYNGSVDLLLPPSVAVTSAVSSGTGEYRSGFEISSLEDEDRPKSILAKVKDNIEEYQFGKINGGGIPLRIESQNGTIQIRKTGNSPQ